MAAEARAHRRVGLGCGSEEIQVSRFIACPFGGRRGTPFSSFSSFLRPSTAGSPGLPELPRALDVQRCPRQPGGVGDAGGGVGCFHHSIGNYSSLRPGETPGSDGSAAGGCWMQRELRRSPVRAPAPSRVCPGAEAGCSRLSLGELCLSEEEGFSISLGTHHRLGGPSLPLAASPGEAVRKALTGDAKP